MATVAVLVVLLGLIALVGFFQEQWLTLGLLHKGAVPFLSAGLNEPYWYVRVEMLKGLTELSHEATNAFPSIVRALKDTNDEVREWAMKALVSLAYCPAMKKLGL